MRGDGEAKPGADGFPALFRAPLKQLGGGDTAPDLSVVPFVGADHRGPVVEAVTEPVPQQAADRLHPRHRVVRAAQRLFTERGYLYTTMADIAAEASVAVQTLYLSFGSKAQILSAAFDRSVVGDDEPLAVLERPWVGAVRDEPDLGQALRLLVAEGTAIVARATPIYLRVQEACADVEVAEVLATQRARRYETDRALAALLTSKPGFAAGLTAEAAGDIVYAVFSEDAYRLLCMDRGWEFARWQAWCLAILQATLADPPGAAARSAFGLVPHGAVPHGERDRLRVADAAEVHELDQEP